MLIFDFGIKNSSLTIPFILTCILFSPFIIYLFLLFIDKQRIYRIYKFIAINFFTIWYFLLIIVFSCFTIILYESIDFTKFNLITLISCVLIGLLILPFFKKVVAFGIEAELSFMQKEKNFHIMEEIDSSNAKPLTDEEKNEREKYQKTLEEEITKLEDK